MPWSRPKTTMKTLWLVLCLLSVAGLCLAAPPAHTVPYSSPHGYSLSIPAGWHVKSPSLPGDDADIVTNQEVAVGYKMTKPFFQVQFRPVNNYRVTSASLEEINRGVLSVVRQGFPDLKVLSQTYSTLDGVRAINCTFTATANGLPLRFHEVLVLKNKKAFTFTGFCPNQIYPRYAAAYAQMLSSVRWKS